MADLKTKMAAALLSLTFFSGSMGTAWADEETEELEQQLESLMQQAEEQQQKTEQIQSRIDTVSEQIRELSDAVSEAEKNYKSVKAELETIEGRIAVNQTMLAEKEKELRERSVILHRRVRDIYINGQISYVDVLLGAKDFNDFLTRMELLGRVIRQDFILVQRVRNDKLTVELARRELEREWEAQEALTRKAGERRLELNDRKEDKARLLEKMETDKELSQMAYEEILAASAEIEKMIRQSRYHYPGVTTGVGGMIWPLAGEITSPFGWRVHPITGDARFHSGLDIGGDYGLPIQAAAAGQVIYADWISGYGYSVILDHGGGISTLYAHNDALAVSEGQMVMQGQVIAYCGSTGNSTGPHCHFEVREGGEPVDPLGYL